MPLYDIACAGCGIEGEVFRSVAERHDLPECACGGSYAIVVRAPMVRSDIEPYRAVAVDVATGKAPVIRSRSEHREYLRRNGYVEVGNDPIRKPRSADHGLDSKHQDRLRGQAIKQAIEEVTAR